VGDQKGPNKVDCPGIGYLKTGGEQLFETLRSKNILFWLKKRWSSRQLGKTAWWGSS
jgi:hypothetical protein